MNNDRLKFRTPLTVTTYNDKDEEVELKFMIYDISIYADFQCGLSWDSLMAQIKEQGKHLSDELLQKIEDVVDEWAYDDWVILETLVYPEQCTGIKDIDGHLIYWGDIVYIAGQGNTLIDSDGFFDLLERVKTGNYDDIGGLRGNIHQNAEILNEN